MIINDQINAELWSAYLYLSMSMDAEAKNWRGVANWFYVQWLEEQDHARILQNYMVSQDAKVILKPIEAVPVEWKNVRTMFESTLSHEKDVTAMIRNIVCMAMEENDFATFSRMKWFVDEQIEEEQSVRDIISDIEKMGDCRYGYYSIDRTLGERKYEKASPLK